MEEALDLLARWDGQNSGDSSAAAVTKVLWEHVTARMIANFGGDLPKGTLRLVPGAPQSLSPPLA